MVSVKQDIITATLTKNVNQSLQDLRWLGVPVIFRKENGHSVDDSANKNGNGNGNGGNGGNGNGGNGGGNGENNSS